MSARAVRSAVFLAAMMGCGLGIQDDPNAGGSGSCTPSRCEGRCGDQPDGCGGVLACGPCAAQPGTPDSPGGDAAAANECDGRLPGTWTMELADAKGDTGLFPSIDVDSEGVAHVAYYASTGSVRYARRDGSARWSLETLEALGVGDAGASLGDTGAGTSLRIDGSATPVVAYRDPEARALKYARREAGAWRIETVDSDGDLGAWPSLALAGADTHVAYYDHTAKSLKGAHRDGTGAWSVETIDATRWAGQHASLVRDAAGGLHVTYAAGGAFREAHRPQGGAWTTAFMADSKGLFSALAVDSLSGLHVAYHDGRLRYARRPGPTKWTVETVDQGTATDTTGFSASLAVDGQELHIAYLNLSTNELRHAHRSGSGAWKLSTLAAFRAPRDEGRYVSIAIGSDHVVHVAYYDSEAGDLRYARRCP